MTPGLPYPPGSPSQRHDAFLAAMRADLRHDPRCAFRASATLACTCGAEERDERLKAGGARVEA